jgi:hypothetical protein
MTWSIQSSSLSFWLEMNAFQNSPVLGLRIGATALHGNMLARWLRAVFSF